MSEGKVLVIDDEPDIRQLLEITLMRMGLTPHSAEDVTSGKAALAADDYDVCLTDMQMPDGTGLEIVKHIAEHYPTLPVAVITAHGTMDAAITALKLGAFDFVSKPVDLKLLRGLINQALKLKNTPTVTQGHRPSSDSIGSEGEFGTQLIGQSEPVQRLRNLIKKASRGQAPVFIHGESGTGKELVARLLHESGPRADGDFVAVNCGAIPSELMESEFFGHKKGSFTGATSDKQGLFEAADGGTLFLDEIADLPLAMQVKLLRAIQEKKVRPIGGSQEIDVDVRILSATHKNLEQLVVENKFRQDLFYRINVIGLRTPPLRERGDDILLIADHILDKLAAMYGAHTLDDSARIALANYSFMGNIRELENILERAMTLSEGDVLSEEDLNLPQTQSNVTFDEDVDAALTGFASPGGDPKNIPIETIQAALLQARGNQTKAADMLGLTPRQLRYRLQKHEDTLN